MSQDAIAAIGRAHFTQNDPYSAPYGVQSHPIDLQALDMRTPQAAQAKPVTALGGAEIAHPSAQIQAPAPAVMSLPALAGQFADGLQHGFYAPDMNRLMHKLVQSRQPNSGVSFGDVTVELLNVQAKLGVAEAFSKISTKLADGLQTMVVRQG